MINVKREIWLEPIRRSKRQLSMTFGIDDLRFETAYWYNDVDLYALEEKYGNAFMEKVYFHILLFEANKLWSLCPSTINLGPYAHLHTVAFENFWRHISHKAWTEWRYSENLPDYVGPKFTTTPQNTSQNTSPSPIEIEEGKVEILTFCGGGKDSLVSMKLLEQSDLSYASFVYSHSIYGPATPQHQLIDELLDHCAAHQRHQISVFDSFVDSPVLHLYPEYGVNSLKAAETPSTTFAALPVILQHGYTYMVRGHEHSANVGNLIWDATGEDVNHQWGKSLEAEQAINDYLRQEFCTNVSYFSILQPIHDVVIFNLLRQNVDAVASTHSCNLNKPWCCKCPKCAYVWLNYMAYLPTELVDEIFKVNLFDLEENQLSFYQMLGLDAHTPFDCIGQIAEARLAFELCRRKGLTGSAMDMYLSHFPNLDVESILEKYLTIHEPSNVLPSLLVDPVSEQMYDAVQETRKYVDKFTSQQKASPKADFDNIYAMYRPTKYVNDLVRELHYELPFQTIEKIETYIQRLSFAKPIQCAIIGSAHGLDAVVLKYGMTSEEIVARWSDESTLFVPFQESERTSNHYECTLIDIEPEPLRFATDINLADRTFVADLSQRMAEPLRQHFQNDTDILIATGMISYLGIDGLERLLEATFLNGKTQIFCFSALKFLEVDALIATCQKYGLVVHKIIDSPHRLYQSEAEKQRVQSVLAHRGIHSDEDEHGLSGYVFLAYRKHMDSLFQEDNKQL